jgi:heterotetrameric sarcosine oxidase gamma subunit
MIYNVNIKRLELFCVFDLKGSRTDIASFLTKLQIVPPETPNTAAIFGNVTLCWVGPKHWILRAPQTEADTLTLEFQTSEIKERNTSIVEVSDMLQFFSIHGPDANDVIAVCSTLDTHSTVFPRNAVTYTEIFGTKALLSRDVFPDSEGFQIAVDRSYADFIDDNLHRILGAPLEVNHAGRTAQVSNLEHNEQ